MMAKVTLNRKPIMVASFIISVLVFALAVGFSVWKYLLVANIVFTIMAIFVERHTHPLELVNSILAGVFWLVYSITIAIDWKKEFWMLRNKKRYKETVKAVAEELRKRKIAFVSDDDFWVEKDRETGEWVICCRISYQQEFAHEDEIGEIEEKHGVRIIGV